MANYTSGYRFDFSDVRGNAEAITMIEHVVASHFLAIAVGKPSPALALTGAPGTGKTMLARRIPTILPALSDRDRTWITAEYNGLGLHEWCSKPITERPFRAPHHTISTGALVGTPGRQSFACPMCTKAAERGRPLDPYHYGHLLPGLPASIGRPGELQLARFGVLFLDELIEFSLTALGALREQLDRMAPRTRPLIVAACNPCPCGYAGSTVKQCSCTPGMLARYVARLRASFVALGISDAEVVEVVAPSLDMLRHGEPGPSSASIRERVLATIGGAL